MFWRGNIINKINNNLENYRGARLLLGELCPIGCGPDKEQYKIEVISN